jgi:glutaredoxin
MGVIRVAVYGKRECALCDEVKATLLAVRTEIPFVLDEVDIEATPELREAYEERIPLVFVNGRLAFKFRVDEAALRHRLARERLAEWLRTCLPGRADSP